jgi:antitoxin ParD1/3/4
MDQTAKLSITVTAEQARRIAERVQSGEYASASEVIREGLRSLERDEREHREVIEVIRARVDASLADTRPRLSLDDVRERMQARYEIAGARAPRKA